MLDVRQVLIIRDGPKEGAVFALCGNASGYSFLRRFQHITKAARIASATTPPTTPPAMAAVGVFDVEDTAFEFSVCGESGGAEDGLAFPLLVRVELADEVGELELEELTLE